MTAFIIAATAITFWTVGYPTWRAYAHIRELHRDRQRVEAAVRQLAVLVATNGRWVEGCTDLLREARDSSAPVSYWTLP